MDNQLIGLWSVDILYGSAAASDDLLIFKPDGTGRYEFINLRLCWVDRFQWKVIRDGIISIIGDRCLTVAADEKSIEEEESQFGVQELHYEISEEQTPSGKRMRILRLPLKSPMANCFGFVRTDLVGLEQPEFDLKD